MSSQPNNSQRKSGQQSNSAIVATIAAVGLGAVAAVGAYFMGKSIGEEEAVRKNGTQVNTTSVTSPRPQLSSSDYDDEEVKKPEGEEDGRDGEECSLCFRKYEEVKGRNEEIHTTPCGHIYCERCLKRWLEIKEECPSCKRRVRRGETLRIYL